jgi:hypothetical protein
MIVYLSLSLSLLFISKKKAINSIWFDLSILMFSSLCDDIDNDMKDIDIYLLTLTSKIPELLSAALNNFVILSTLRYTNSAFPLRVFTDDRLQHSYVIFYRLIAIYSADMLM